MQAASNLHDQVRNAFLGEAQNIFDNATAFDAGDNVFDLDARRRENPIEEFVTDTQCLAFRFFFYGGKLSLISRSSRAARYSSG
jgi:hypothetical protein